MIDITRMAAQRAEQYAIEHPDDPEQWRRKPVAELIQDAVEELADNDNYLRWALLRLDEMLEGSDSGVQRRGAILRRFLWLARSDGQTAYAWLRQGLYEWAEE